MSRKEQIWELCDKVHRDLKLAGLPLDGGATDGTSYPSIKAMWSAELGLGDLPPVATTVGVVRSVGVARYLYCWSKDLTRSLKFACMCAMICTLYMLSYYCTGYNKHLRVLCRKNVFYLLCPGQNE